LLKKLARERRMRLGAAVEFAAYLAATISLSAIRR
jgi:hypothetical protein